jgi:DNA-binding MarR family transcriptional regulator
MEIGAVMRRMFSHAEPGESNSLTVHCHIDNLLSIWQDGIMNTDTKAATLIPLIVADIYELAGHFRADGEEIARAVGQTQARWQVMSAASADPLTVPRIARRLGVTRQNVQRIADLLVAEGWATFTGNPDHKGSPFLLLNARGQAALAKIAKAAGQSHARLARQLAETDVGALHRGLRRLILALNDRDNSE